MRRPLVTLFMMSLAACTGGAGRLIAPPIDDLPDLDGVQPDPPSEPPAVEPPTSGGPPPTTNCKALAVAPAQSLNGFLVDRYTWFDQDCTPRMADMVRNTEKDPAGFFGGYMRRYTYQVSGKARVCESTNPSHPGFGYLVNHYGGGGSSESSRRHAGSTRALLAGPHHAIHEYEWSYRIGGQPVTATVRWLFATGRQNPVWAVTIDTSAAAANALAADSRAPYGDINWDGTGGTVDGVAWGDRYKFVSTRSPVDMSSGWDYSEPNTVPYALEWSSSADAEMGIVQTQTWGQHDAGGYGAYVFWGKKSSGPMPADYAWTYQLNQYEIPFTLSSHRLAWGMNYGAVGQRSYQVYGNDGTASGYPYQSYATHIVLGRHSDAAVAAQVAEVEAVQEAALTASVGEVVTSGPAGVGRTDSVAYAPAGYNPVYGTWELTAQGGRVDVRLTAASALQSPMIAVHGWTSGQAPTSVMVGDRLLVGDVQYFASVDAARQTLWLTLPGIYTGATRIRVQ